MVSSPRIFVLSIIRVHSAYDWLKDRINDVSTISISTGQTLSFDDEPQHTPK